jgi:bifunctional UDP-N-acetylglucosamine pyrophosphorylase/glucosamine-1-phosphate N-acetyltransferase
LEIKNKNRFISVILGAGAGTRMNSNLPKVLHEVLGKPLISWVLTTANSINPTKNILVIGHKSEEIIAYFNKQKLDFNLDFVLQKKQLGSGDAVKSAITEIDDAFNGHVLILCGDTPLLTTTTIDALMNEHLTAKNDATILTAIANNPFSYGKKKKKKNGNVLAIIEEKDATENEKKIQEINSGVYCFKYSFLKNYINRIEPNNSKKEYYLTDMIKLINQAGGLVGTYITSDFAEIFGINDKIALAEANKEMQSRINKKFMLAGVNIPFPETVYIENSVKIAKDATIYPNTILNGNVEIDESCEIGPDSFIENSKIGKNTIIKYSYISDSVIGNNVNIGPFSHIRPNSNIKNNCKVGNFSEIKKSIIGEGSKVSHLSYIGDAELGKNVNVGAGTITCNYDGEKKYKTIIKDNTFVGSNTNFVAPVIIGKSAFIAAGSTIYQDVPDNALGIARGRQENKKNWKQKLSK